MHQRIIAQIPQKKRLDNHLSRVAAKLWLGSLFFCGGYSKKYLMLFS